jgi:very-short-patch-repair endonuclease
MSDGEFRARGWRSPPDPWSALRAKAREMRRGATPAEDRLWGQLRSSKLGVRFRRQHAIGQFIVDFYCAQAQLVIEVDGLVHVNSAEQDLQRQEYLEQVGLTVVRFNNEEVLSNLDLVVGRIAQLVTNRLR